MISGRRNDFDLRALHRENILRPDFTETGVGISQQGRTYFFTREFLRPR